MSEAMYEITVITPFHNVNLSMFEAARKSVMEQTIGFENIQWIIVLHNCEPHYLDEIPALFSGCDNVIIPVLNNEAKTPSSPRNHGLSLATAPYVAFLDGDDSFTPDCLRTVVEELRNNKAEVACFRREYELERMGLSVLTETILWNQAEERILVEKGNWDVEKMFNGVYGMATSKVFDREFLNRNHITFDETIPYAEDMDFTTNTFVAADRILYLPQLIGYHYFINADSLVQSSEKSGATLVSYAQGMAKLFDSFLRYGIESDVVQGLCLQEAFFILRSGQTTVEDRLMIRDILAPYLLDEQLLLPNKIRDIDTCRMMYFIPREVILNPEDPYSGLHVKGMKDGFLSLSRILLQNADTDYGKKYSFNTLKTVQAYQFRVPLSTCETIRPLLNLQTNVGEQGILTSNSMRNYFETEDGSRYPSTEAHFKQYVAALGDTLSHNKSLLLAELHGIRKITNDGAEISDLETAVIRSLIHTFMNGHPEYEITLSSKRGTYYSYEGESIYQKLLTDALLASDLEQIVALDTSRIAYAFSYMEENADLLVKLIAEKNPKRAKEVSQIFEQGFDQPIALSLWHHLKRTVAYGAGDLYQSTESMKKYTGELSHNHGYLYSPVALLGKAVEDNSDLFTAPTQDGMNFYELLPLKNNDNDEAISLSHAEINQPYQLVVTNQAGLYRFVTEHFIYVRDVNFSDIRFTIY